MYERLLNIFYCRGRLTHSDRECSLWIRNNGTLKEDDKQFGSWLCIVTPHPSRKMVVRVAGYEEEFHGNGRTDGDDDVSENVDLIGRGLGNISTPSATLVMVAAKVLPRAEVEFDIGVDPKQTILARPSFQGIAGDTPSITDDVYPLLGGSNLGREGNVVT